MISANPWCSNKHGDGFDGIPPEFADLLRPVTVIDGIGHLPQSAEAGVQDIRQPRGAPTNTGTGLTALRRNSRTFLARSP